MEKNSNIGLVQHNSELGLTTTTGQRHGCGGHSHCPKGGGSPSGALTRSMGQGTALNAALKPGCKPGLAQPRQGRDGGSCQPLPQGRERLLPAASSRRLMVCPGEMLQRRSLSDALARRDGAGEHGSSTGEGSRNIDFQHFKAFRPRT